MALEAGLDAPLGRRPTPIDGPRPRVRQGAPTQLDYVGPVVEGLGEEGVRHPQQNVGQGARIRVCDILQKEQ